MLRLSAEQRHQNEARIRLAIDRLRRGDIQPCGKSASRPPGADVDRTPSTAATTPTLPTSAMSSKPGVSAIRDRRDR
jgi:hypothetical protein